MREKEINMNLINVVFALESRILLGFFSDSSRDSSLDCGLWTADSSSKVDCLTDFN